jgi:hypothetical protein
MLVSKYVLPARVAAAERSGSVFVQLGRRYAPAQAPEDKMRLLRLQRRNILIKKYLHHLYLV